MPLHKAGDDSSFAESELCSRSWSPGEGAAGGSEQAT